MFLKRAGLGGVFLAGYLTGKSSQSVDMGSSVNVSPSGLHSIGLAGA